MMVRIEAKYIRDDQWVVVPGLEQLSDRCADQIWLPKLRADPENSDWEYRSVPV